MFDVTLVTCADAGELDMDLPPLVSALSALGLSSEIVPWHDPSFRWDQTRLALLRSPWDYAQRYVEFCAWLRRVASQTCLLNPLEMVLWNLDKRYLASLAEHGVPIVPTRFVEPGQTVSLPEARELVVKPAVSAGSRNTMRHTVRAQAQAHAESLLAQGHVVMIQPYLARVDEQGETALLFFDGKLSHTIRKGPLLSPDGAATSALFAPEQISAREPAADEREVAMQVLRALPFERSPLYARVDLLRDDQGAPRLLELELAEPALFFPTHPEAAPRLAAAIAGRLRALRSA